jgi:peroxiredoxin
MTMGFASMNNPVTRIQAAAGVLTLALCWFVADSLRERVVSVGDKAPRFQVTSDSGKVISRSAFGGQLLVLNFWATWCPPCVDELPSLNEMARQLGPRGVVVLGVSVDTNEKAYRDFLARTKVAFETSRDPEAGISAEYGTFKYPETYIINREGRVVQKYIGPRDWTDPKVMAGITSAL